MIADGDGRKLPDVDNPEPESSFWAENSDPIRSIRMTPIWQASELQIRSVGRE
jgi:hypothetical protein